MYRIHDKVYIFTFWLFILVLLCLVVFVVPTVQNESIVKPYSIEIAQVRKDKNEVIIKNNDDFHIIKLPKEALVDLEIGGKNILYLRDHEAEKAKLKKKTWKSFL